MTRNVEKEEFMVIFCTILLAVGIYIEYGSKLWKQTHCGGFMIFHMLGTGFILFPVTITLKSIFV